MLVFVLPWVNKPIIKLCFEGILLYSVYTRACYANSTEKIMTPFLRKILNFGIIVAISALAFAWAYEERTLTGVIFAVQPKQSPR